MASPKDSRHDEILRRYWEGESTLEDEAWLRANEADHPLFQYLNRERNEGSQLRTNDIIGERVATAPPDKPGRVLKINRWITGIAATLLILAAATFIIKPNQTAQEQPVLYAETYQNPEEAYEQVKQALLLVSSTINKTSDKVAKQISKAEPYSEIFK